MEDGLSTLPISAAELARAPGVGKTRTFPKLFLSLRNDLPGEKRRLIATVFTMICRGVLPQHGELVKNNPKGYGPRRVSQAMMTPAMGVASRTTVTHRIADFSDRSEIPEWRTAPLWKSHAGGFAEANAYEICAALRKTHEYQVVRKGSGKRAENGKFGRLDRARKFCGLLNGGLDETSPDAQWRIKEFELDPNCFYYHDAADLVWDPPEKAQPRIDADERGSEKEQQQDERAKEFEKVKWMFDKDLAAEGFAGFAKIPVFLWDSSLGIDDDARLAATWYLMCGIDSVRGKNGKPQLWLTVSQKKSCRRLGMSVDTLRKAHRQLADIGLFRFRGQLNPRDGRNTVQKIEYMPIRRLNVLHMRAERRRLHRAARQQHEDRKALRMRLRMIRRNIDDLAQREQTAKSQSAERLNVVSRRSKAMLLARKALGGVAMPQKASLVRLAAANEQSRLAVIESTKGIFELSPVPPAKGTVAYIEHLRRRSRPGQRRTKGIRIDEFWKRLRANVLAAGADAGMVAALIPNPDL